MLYSNFQPRSLILSCLYLFDEQVFRSRMMNTFYLCFFAGMFWAGLYGFGISVVMTSGGFSSPPPSWIFNLLVTILVLGTGFSAAGLYYLYFAKKTDNWMIRHLDTDPYTRDRKKPQFIPLGEERDFGTGDFLKEMGTYPI